MIFNLMWIVISGIWFNKLPFIGVNLNYSALKSYTMRDLRTKKSGVTGLIKRIWYSMVASYPRTLLPQVFCLISRKCMRIFHFCQCVFTEQLHSFCGARGHDFGSGAKVCVSKPKGSPVLICAYGLAHWKTSWPSLGCFRDKRRSKSTFYIVFRYSLYAFRPKHCQGVLLVRSSSPCSRMKTAKIVCCPGNLPKNTDEMQKNRPSSGFSPQK